MSPKQIDGWDREINSLSIFEEWRKRSSGAKTQRLDSLYRLNDPAFEIFFFPYLCVCGGGQDPRGYMDNQFLVATSFSNNQSTGHQCTIFPFKFRQDLLRWEWSTRVSSVASDRSVSDRKWWALNEGQRKQTDLPWSWKEDLRGDWR